MKKYRSVLVASLLVCMLAFVFVSCDDSSSTTTSGSSMTVKLVGELGAGNTPAFGAVSINGTTVTPVYSGTNSGNKGVFYAQIPSIPSNGLVTVSAAPDLGYVFDEWEYVGGSRRPVLPLTEAQENSFTVTMNIADIPYYRAEFDRGYYVDSSFTGSSTGAYDAPFTTVTEAITAAQVLIAANYRVDEATVIVAAGEYLATTPTSYEAISITSPISLKGGYNTYDAQFPWVRNYVSNTSMLYSKVGAISITTPTPTNQFADFDWDDMVVDGFDMTSLTLTNNLMGIPYDDDDIELPQISHNQIGAIDIESLYPVAITGNVITGNISSNVSVLLASNIISSATFTFTTNTVPVRRGLYLFNNMIVNKAILASASQYMNNIIIDDTIAATPGYAFKLNNNISLTPEAMGNYFTSNTMFPQYMLNPFAENLTPVLFTTITKSGTKISESMIERYGFDESAIEYDFFGSERSDDGGTWSIGPYEYYPEDFNWYPISIL